MGTQHAMGSRGPPRTWEALDAVLVALVDRIARRLRAARRVCRTIVLRMRFDDFTRATRSHTVAEATARTPTILAIARGLLDAAMPTIEEKGITLLGIALSNLDDDAAIQLAFPFDQVRAVALDEVLDAIRERFGSEAITRGVLIGQRRHLEVPLLPD